MSKKDFNTAEMFVSVDKDGKAAAALDRQENQDLTATDYKAHEFKATKDRNEQRSRRVNLLMKPSIHTDLQVIAHINRISVNNLIEKIISDFIEKLRIK